MINLSKHPLLPPATVGILGAGQLGKMLCHSAQKMGYQVHVYDTKEACAFGTAHQGHLGDFNDEEKVLAFSDQVDTLTYEFENINANLLEQLESKPHFIQGTNLLTISKNRLREKEWLQSIGAQVVEFKPIEKTSDLVQIGHDLSYPFIIKTTELGYDGKGQVKIDAADDLKEKSEEIESIVSQGAIAEAYCPFDYEVSVIVGRNAMGEIECFPPTINIHRAGILCASYTANKLSGNLLKDIQSIASKIAKESNMIGVCGVEFFVTQSQEVIVNEIAPRPHNSGHYTIEGCNLSQFDQHILAITNRELIEPRLNKPTLSINILGQHMKLIEELSKELPQAIIHIYDKGEPKQQRKMGHFTLTFETQEQIHQLLDSDFLNKWFDLIG